MHFLHLLPNATFLLQAKQTKVSEASHQEIASLQQRTLPGRHAISARQVRGQVLATTMNHGEHLDCLILYAINQAVGKLDQLTNLERRRLWHAPTGLRELLGLPQP